MKRLKKCFFLFMFRLGSNAVYKTRIMAANALIPLVSLEKTPEFVRTILDNINTNQNLDKMELKTRQNTIHGNLLQLKALLSKLCNRSDQNVDMPSLVVYIVQHSVWLTQSPIVSPHSKKVVVDVLIVFKSEFAG